MFSYYFEAGGPVMYFVLGALVVVLAAIFDRLFYAFGMALRRPIADIERLVAAGQLAAAQACFEQEKRRSVRGLSRIDSVSQIATSLGLFGTVFGIARAFTARGGSLGSAASEVLASGLTTALFTTVAGLIVFLFGQGFLIVWGEWLEARDRAATELLERGVGRP